MQKRLGLTLLLAGIGVVMPFLSWAQDAPVTGLSSTIQGLQATLETVYNTMMQNCGELISVGESLAGLGALLYISYHVWGQLARVDEIDVFPLFRPFAIGLVISGGMYPAFIGVLNGVLQPTVAGTAALVNDANTAITTLLQQKEAALEQSTDWQMYVGPNGGGSEEKWQQYSGEAETGVFSGLSNAVKFNIERMMYNFRNSVKVVLSQIMQLVYEAAGLCINTLRTFELVLLGILGPLVLGLTVFPGFEHLLTSWLGRYVNVFLWLPVANIFGSLCGQIQAAMIKIDLQQIQTSGQTSFGETDAAYLIFLIIASIGYFCVPSITSRIIQVSTGGSGHAAKVTSVAKAGAGMAASAVAGGVGGGA
jgi:conjugative transposon TraJ protein